MIHFLLLLILDRECSDSEFKTRPLPKKKKILKYSSCSFVLLLLFWYYHV